MTGNGSANSGPIGPKRASAAKPNVKFGARHGRMSPLPLEWMDPMSWRLPSGKALAEFALQSGFLAPLIMGGAMGRTSVVRRKPLEKAAVVEGPAARGSSEGSGKPPVGVPVSAGSFRETSVGEGADKFREGRYGSAQ